MDIKFFRKGFIFIFAIILCFTVYSCSEEEDDVPPCNTEAIFSITEVSVPETAKINESITVIITYYKPNPCYTFEDLDMQFGERELTLKVLGTFDCEQICTQNVVQENFTHTLQVGTAGEYTLRFYVSEDEYITKTITITE